MDICNSHFSLHVFLSFLKPKARSGFDPLPRRLAALTFGLVLNAFGNGITISSNIGTAPWGASEVNLAHIFHTSIALADQHLWHNLHHNIALPKAISDRAE